MVVSFVKGEGDACTAAPTADWDEIEADGLTASFKHEEQLTEAKDVCFAVKVVIGEETTFCDLKVSDESDGFKDGYQPENALKVTLKDLCGDCSPLASCNGKKLITQARVCQLREGEILCEPTGTPETAKTCGDLEYCVETGATANCSPCDCTAAITCDGTDQTKGTKALAACNASGQCLTDPFTCADIVTCEADPAGIRTKHGRCSATEETGCAFDEGTVLNCDEAPAPSCDGLVLKTPAAVCSEG